MSDAIKAFHAHLDVCKQCANNPFGLCKSGEKLLLAWGDEDAIKGVHKMFGLPLPSSGAERGSK